MNSIFILIPVTFILLGFAIAAWIWSVKSDQFSDLDKEASRILFDEVDDASSSDDLATGELIKDDLILDGSVKDDSVKDRSMTDGSVKASLVKDSSVKDSSFKNSSVKEKADGS